MRTLVIGLFAFLISIPVFAQNPAPVSGTITIETNQPFAAYIENLKAAIKANKMGIIAEACATCGAKSIGVTIPGNHVIMIFNPHFAVRMLEASREAGVEAPLRLYVTENEDGTAQLSFRPPSHVFAPYNAPALDKMAAELDAIFEKIVAGAME